jgi:uncharacterized membrane protein
MIAFKRRLQREIESWVGKGLISEEQSGAILAEYKDGDAFRSGRLAAVAAVLGGAFVITGLALIISSNWQEIHRWIKIGGLLVLLAGFYYGGWRLKFREPRYPRSGDALLMVGAALFMLGISLVSQIYHVDARPATGVMIWWLGIVAVPYLMTSRAVQFLSLAALTTWLTMEIFTEGSWINVEGEFGFINISFLHLSLGAVFFLASFWHSGGFAVFRGVMEKSGILLMFWAVYFLGFLHEVVPLEGEPWLPLTYLIVALGTLALSRSRFPATGRSTWFLPLALGLTMALAAASLFALHDPGFSVLSVSMYWFLSILFPLVFVFSGVEWQRAGWVNAGLAMFTLALFTRYFDLVWDMMGTGLLFLVSGVVILVGGFYLERLRRRLIASIKQTSASPTGESFP